MCLVDAGLGSPICALCLSRFGVLKVLVSVHVNADPGPASPICVLWLLCLGVLIIIDWCPKSSLLAWQKQSYHVNAVLVQAHPVCV